MAHNEDNIFCGCSSAEMEKTDLRCGIPSDFASFYSPENYRGYLEVADDNDNLEMEKYTVGDELKARPYPHFGSILGQCHAFSEATCRRGSDGIVQRAYILGDG